MRAHYFLPLLAALAAAQAPAPLAARVALDFSFGWRFFLGDPTAPPPPACNNASLFPISISGVECQGLSALPAATADACLAEACEAGLAAWQFCTDAAKCAAGGRAVCWGGAFNASSCRANKPWVGGARTALPPPPSPAPAATAWDDRAWEVVDAPHDALIGTPYSNATSNSQGSIPKNVSWYRKHFVLPAAWEGSHVSAYFDGAFAVTTAYLNGVRVMNHMGSGYTSFAVRLDNASGAVWGGENVLALFIDATVTTGWW